MVWLNVEAHLTIHPSDQGVQGISGNVDHRLAVGALQVSMRNWRCQPGRFWYREVVDRCRATDVSVGDEPELPECRQRTIDRCPVHSRSRRLGPRHDFIGCQVLLSAV